MDETCPSWTTLKNADSATNSIEVDAAFARCLGYDDELLISSDTNSPDGANIFFVESVEENVVTLKEPLPRVFPTEAGPGESVFAVEVAKLTRDVVFEAESDADDDLIGGHSIVLHTPDVPQTLHGVRFQNFGQAGVLGRYPIHFHKSGDSPSSVSRNVVVNSNHRCVMIHDTNRVTVSDNVAYDTAGHCFATETGSERFNVFADNLGSKTKKLTRDNGQSDSPGVTKTEVSTFWFRNMENTL